MGIDVQQILPGEHIKIGTIVTGTRPTGLTSKNNDYVIYDTPTSGEVGTKYQDRFDDPTYYTA